VDKIVGPGNIYVATAKKILFGTVAIDMIAGPTEVVIVANDLTDPRLIAADMLAQAEHDPNASAIVIMLKPAKLDPLLQEIEIQTSKSKRRSIIKKSLTKNGAIILVKNKKEAIHLVNLKAPEHLEILTENPMTMAKKCVHAGAVFVGPWSAEAIGDYVAGPNHTLPTGRTARFSSPLGVMDFIKSQHIVKMSRQGFLNIAPAGIALAEVEHFYAHADSLKLRAEKQKLGGKN
jgi:histidinol dehydrogenase